MREINISAVHEFVKGAGVPVGAAGSGRDVALKVSFSDDWEGLLLEAQWRDARGGGPVNGFLSEPDEDGKYTVVVPFAAKKYAGKCSVTFKGYALTGTAAVTVGDERISVTVTDAAKVKDYVNDNGTGGEAELKYVSGSPSAWKLNGEGDAVDLSGVGISVSGTPAANDKITLSITEGEAKLSAYAEFDVLESAWRQDAPGVDPTEGEMLHGEIETHAGRTNNPHGVTKEQVGLGNADNTSDADKPVSAATQAELDLKLDKAGGEMTGTLLTESVSVKAGKVLTFKALNGYGVLFRAYASSNGGGVMIRAYEPNDDPTDPSAGVEIMELRSSSIYFNTPIFLASGGKKIFNVATPTSNLDAVNKKYADDGDAAALSAAKTYADEEATAAENAAKTYADGKVKNSGTNGDISIKTEANKKAELKSYTGAAFVKVEDHSGILMGGSVSVKSTGGVNFNNSRLFNVDDPTNETDAANKRHVAAAIAEHNEDDAAHGDIRQAVSDAESAAIAAAETDAAAKVSAHDVAENAHGELFSAKLDKAGGELSGELKIRGASIGGISLKGLGGESNPRGELKVLKGDISYGIAEFYPSGIKLRNNVDANGAVISGLPTPNDEDADDVAANKGYVDEKAESKLDKDDGTATGEFKIVSAEGYGVSIEGEGTAVPKAQLKLRMGENGQPISFAEINSAGVKMKGGATVTGLPTPINDTDAANKAYVRKLEWKPIYVIKNWTNFIQNKTELYSLYKFENAMPPTSGGPDDCINLSLLPMYREYTDDPEADPKLKGLMVYWYIPKMNPNHLGVGRDMRVYFCKCPNGEAPLGAQNEPLRYMNLLMPEAFSAEQKSIWKMTADHRDGAYSIYRTGVVTDYGNTTQLVYSMSGINTFNTFSETVSPTSIIPLAKGDNITHLSFKFLMGNNKFPYLFSSTSEYAQLYLLGLCEV